MTLNCPYCAREFSLAAVVPLAGKLDANADAVDEAVQQLHAASDAQERVVSLKKAKPRNYVYEDSQFLQFWEVYPDTRGKADAYRRWVEVRKAGIQPEVLIAAAERYALWCKANPDKLVKMAEGWLHAGRWDDDLPVPAPAGEAEVAYVGTDEWAAESDAEYERIQREWQ